MRQALAHNRGDVPWIFQQDSAPAHRAKKQEFLKEGVNFWPPAWEMASKPATLKQPQTQDVPDTHPAGCWTIDQKAKVQGVEIRTVSAFWIGENPRRLPPI